MSKIMTAREYSKHKNIPMFSYGDAIKFAEAYAKYVLKAALPEKITVKYTSTENPSVDGWNACIDQIKQNAGIE